MVWIDAARGRRGAAALVAGLLASALCGAASADDYETELLGGVAARDRALETRDERDWRQALLHLGRAVALQSTAEAEFEFAEAAAHLALWPEAYSGYQAALALGIDGVAAVRAREFLDAHAAGVALLDLSGPAGAVVYVGERRRGALPLARPLAVSLGALVVRVEQPGFRTWQQQLTASAGTHTQLTVSLLPVAAAQPAAPVAAFSDVPPEPAGWARPALIAGASVFALSGAGIVITSALLPGARRDLESSCANGFDKDGNCTGTLDEQAAAAQSAADRVLTLESLRWVSVAGAIVGLAGAAVGFIELQGHSASTATAEGFDLQLTQASFGIHYAGRF